MARPTFRVLIFACSQLRLKLRPRLSRRHSYREATIIEMPQSDTEADTRSISKASIQQDAASPDTAAATSTTALSELRSLLSTLYNPAEWNDGPGPPELRFHVLGDNEWYSDCQAGVKALRDGQYGDTVDRFSQVSEHVLLAQFAHPAYLPTFVYAGYIESTQGFALFLLPENLASGIR